MTVFAYEVSVAGTEWRKVINAPSAGKAKAEYLRDVNDAWPPVSYMDVRCRKLGAAQSSPEFLSVARRRGLPDARCGQRVRVGAEHGVIVGYNASLNFDVLFEEGRYVGQVMNVHPAGLVFVKEEA